MENLINQFEVNRKMELRVAMDEFWGVEFAQPQLDSFSVFEWHKSNSQVQAKNFPPRVNELKDPHSSRITGSLRAVNRRMTGEG